MYDYLKLLPTLEGRLVEFIAPRMAVDRKTAIHIDHRANVTCPQELSAGLS
jgi:hypothetical protein